MTNPSQGPDLYSEPPLVTENHAQTSSRRHTANRPRGLRRMIDKWILPMSTLGRRRNTNQRSQTMSGEPQPRSQPASVEPASTPGTSQISRTKATDATPCAHGYGMSTLKDVNQATLTRNVFFNSCRFVQPGDATSMADSELHQANENDVVPIPEPIIEISAENDTTVRQIPKADHDIYYDQLLVKGRGLPLWIPGPNLNLPAAYQKDGTSIGDVGIFYRFEGFSFLFNIFLPARHVINKGRVPEGFYPLKLSKVRKDIEKKMIYGPDTCLASSTLHKTRNRDSSGFIFETSDKEGAVLVMPDGTISHDLLNCGILEAYVKENAKHWYKYIFDECGRKVDNGDIRLVIGVDKVSSWGIATFESTVKQRVRLEFKGIDGRTGTTYIWNCGNGRVGPSGKEVSRLRSEIDLPSILENQCVFMRTLNFSLSEKVWKESFALRVRSGKGGSLDLAPSNCPQNGGTPGGQSSSADVIFDSTPFGQPVSHPSTRLHKYLLEQYPNAEIVITEDKHWISGITERDVVTPSQEEICARILASFDANECDGIVRVKEKDVQHSVRVKNLPEPALPTYKALGKVVSDRLSPGGSEWDKPFKSRLSRSPIHRAESILDRASAIFSSPSNFGISDRNFVQIINPVQYNSSKPSLDLLREHCALGALLDAKEHFDRPRCAPKTRVTISKDIIDWVTDNEQLVPRILWLHGAAGTGKSAIAQTIAQNYKDNGVLIASHFFSRTSERSDGDRVIPTLTLQLQQAFPVLERHIKGVIRKDPGIFNRLRSIQMEELVVKPLHCRRLTRLHFMRRWLFRFQMYIDPQAHNGRLIVIDGLDECSDPEVQCDLLHIIASACSRIALPLRFLIASRPEIHIIQTFDSKAFELIGVKRINLGDDPDADLDIRQHLLGTFEGIRVNHPFGADFHPTEDMITNLVNKSSALFIYSDTVIKYIQHPRGRPDKRLEAILGISSPRVGDRPFAQLDALYMHIFSSANGIHNDTINSIFGIMSLASQQQYDYLKPSLTFLELALALETREIILLLDDFVSLVDLPQDPAEPIQFFHSSFLGFLHDPERSGEFGLDLSVAHEAVATYFSRCLEDTPFNTVTDYRRFLLHSKEARLSNRLQEYLSSGLLIETFIHTIKEWPIVDMALVFHQYFDLLLTKGFKNAEDLHFTHAMQISEHLARVVRTWDPSFEYDALGNPFMSRIYAAEFRVYKVLESISNHHEYPSVQMLLAVINRHKGDTRVLKYHIVNLFPQLSAKEIEFCTHCASSVGSLTVGNELDDIVGQTIREYINRVEKEVDVISLENFKVAWQI